MLFSINKKIYLKSILVRRLLLATAFLSWLNGCIPTFSSVKMEETGSEEAAINDMVRYLETLHGKLETCNLVGPSTELVEKLNSKLNPNLSYPNKYWLHERIDIKSQNTASDWVLIFGALLTMGTLVPIPTGDRADHMIVGVLLDVTNDASCSIVGYTPDLLNSKDPRIVGRFKIISEYNCYRSALIPSAWLAGLNSSYINKIGYATLNTEYYVPNASTIGEWVNYTTLVHGLHDVLKKLSEKSIDIRITK